MKKNICLVLAVVCIMAVSMIPVFAQTTFLPDIYYGATITVVHNGYNYLWEVDPGMPLGVIEINTSGSSQHYAWTAIRIGEYSNWDEDWGSKGYTSHCRSEIIAYGYPSGLETDYCAFYNRGY